ncbi:MAG TPA: N-formylglutamate amidohydrolase [Gemmatimonadaceae bacterium]|nr:N-formylglutamate amidohydrolase [Gemmatimonadaceae bacterium]
MTAAATLRVRRPDGVARLVYDSPHSGREYPPDWRTKASGAELRRGEDAYVDELLGGAVALGAVLLDALLPRCYLDVNRALGDIDADLLAEPWPEPLAPTDKTRRGLGLIRRYVVPGVEINAERLSVADVQRRIADVYAPYHAALADLVAAQVRHRGACWHVNWHSMKSVGNAMTPDGPGARRADFVVSDRDGASASPALTALIADTLRAQGYRVAVNDPYKGGTIVQEVGRPAAGVHSVQVEINRALYLDEVRVEKSAGFAALAANLDALTTTLARAAP